MLSVVITTWNEAKTLPRAVASVKKLAGEIVVVDTQSTDDTVLVAKKLGCKVFTYKNTGIVEPVRNFSISKASGDWILLLDADEEIPLPLFEKISEIISSKSSADFYRIPRKNIIFNKWITSDHWWPDYVYRLFKKGSVTWEDTIHSVPFTRGTGSDFPADSNLAIIHHHYQTIFQFIDRLNRYTDHGLTHLQKNGYNFTWTDLITKPAEEFIRQYFSRHGYTNGLHGLSLSLLQAISELTLYLKAWENSQFPETSVSATQVSQTFAKKGREFNWWSYQAKIDQGNLFQKIYLKLVRKIFGHAN